MASTCAATHADRLYELAHCDPANPPGLAILLGCLLGPDAADWTSRPVGVSEARLFMRGTGWRVLIPRGLKGPTLCVALARVLARWYILAHPVVELKPPPVEELAAAIALPDDAVRTALSRFGRDPVAIGARLSLPSGLVALRIREVFVPPRSGEYASVPVDRVV